jgi:hypothetical protein
VEREPVESRLIRSVGYDLLNSILEVELGEPRRVYEFFDVPYSIYLELMEAESKGSYFNEFIREDYAYQEVGGPPSSEKPDDRAEPDDGAGRDHPE